MEGWWLISEVVEGFFDEAARYRRLVLQQRAL